AALATVLAQLEIEPPEGWRPFRAEAEEASPRAIGRYVAGRSVGRGGMGTVYRCYDPMLHRQVAVKLLAESRASSRESIERFEREARAVSAVEHPAVVSIHDLGESEGRPYAVMPFVEGLTFEAWLDAGRRSLPEVARLVRAIAEGLAAIHAAGMVHRDVKPQNVIVERGAVARLTDFGLVRSDRERALTESGQILGTPAYMAPEQALGDRPIGPWS